MKIQPAINRASRRRNPTIEPITMPAMAPPLNPEPWREDAEVAPVPVDAAPFEDDVVDDDDSRFDIVEKTGNETP